MIDRTLMELAGSPVSEKQFASVQALRCTLISHSTCTLLRRRGYYLQVDGNHRAPHFWRLIYATHPAGVKT